MSKRCLVSVALVLVSCAGSPAAVQNTRNVLFIGNSLTYTNDLPATFAAIARSAGDHVAAVGVAGPNLALIDHLNGESNALEVLRSRKWDFVVLQQGPTTTTLCRDSLILWTRMFAPHIEQANARPALFMTWPPRTAFERMDEVRKSFEQAAQAVNGVFLPAGEAWRVALQERPSLALYGADNFHPGPLGSYLAALVIYAGLFDVDPRTLPAVAYAAGLPLATSKETVELLQRAAFAAITSRPPAVAAAASTSVAQGC